MFWMMTGGPGGKVGSGGSRSSKVRGLHSTGGASSTPDAAGSHKDEAGSNVEMLDSGSSL